MSEQKQSINVRHSMLRREGIHGLRLLALALIILLIHFKAKNIERLIARDSLRKLSIELVQPYFAEPVHWGRTLSDEPLARELLNQDEFKLGSAFETSPLGDKAIGFSGPTNILIVCDAEDKIRGVKILQSRDTPEHVSIINQDSSFLPGLIGLSLNELARLNNYDGVSGATLTSLAIIDALKLNTGVEQKISSRFKDQLDLEKIKAILPTAVTIDVETKVGSLISIFDQKKKQVGWILRTTPSADQLIGYQGPTDTLMIFNLDRQLSGLIIAETFDNEPYIDYVRTEASFASHFQGKTLEDLANMTLESSGIEGVSGATMTSQTIAASIFHAAATTLEEQRKALKPTPAIIALTIKDYLLVGLVAFTLFFSLSKFRGNAVLRISLRAIMIIYLGFIYGGLLSQAMWVGWIKYGIPLKHAGGLFLLTLVAVIFPITTRQNLYCNHLCPHGALQQLIKPKTSRWKHIPLWNFLKTLLRLTTASLLLLVIYVAISQSTFSLVNLEPFDAYIYEAAGIASILIFIVSLIISRYEPMAYCRLACPTGSLLDYLRRHPQTGHYKSTDIVLLLGLIIAITGYLL